MFNPLYKDMKANGPITEFYIPLEEGYLQCVKHPYGVDCFGPDGRQISGESFSEILEQARNENYFWKAIKATKDIRNRTKKEFNKAKSQFYNYVNKIRKGEEAEEEKRELKRSGQAEIEEGIREIRGVLDDEPPELSIGTGRAVCCGNNLHVCGKGCCSHLRYDKGELIEKFIEIDPPEGSDFFREHLTIGDVIPNKKEIEEVLRQTNDINNIDPYTFSTGFDPTKEKELQDGTLNWPEKKC